MCFNPLLKHIFSFPDFPRLKIVENLLAAEGKAICSLIAVYVDLL